MIGAQTGRSTRSSTGIRTRARTGDRTNAGVVELIEAAFHDAGVTGFLHAADVDGGRDEAAPMMAAGRPARPM
ncbi:hypothetical protein AGRA3207_005637 [Actinomadura graeca]|uniref:Uncharacterized protein n=1 Tax=Actinomadura graeca TaxID=2750812 RepID=A0ABX8QZZ9_9ACTN|nr:hypothetical protein [Actinomadura graeca]QXJ24335.1 hypothetical protein AGRA3207_005637 [Actinomadura graeca]